MRKQVIGINNIFHLARIRSIPVHCHCKGPLYSYPVVSKTLFHTKNVEVSKYSHVELRSLNEQIHSQLTSLTDLNKRQLLLVETLSRNNNLEKLLEYYEIDEGSVEDAIQLLQDSNVSIQEFSSLIQPVLNRTNLVGKYHMGYLSKLMQIYVSLTRTHNGGSVDALNKDDMNKFIKRFIEGSQLKRAQTALQFLLDGYKERGEDLLGPYGDKQTIAHFLMLRSGALLDLWKIDVSNGNNKKQAFYKINGSHRNVKSTYNVLDSVKLFEIVRYILRYNDKDNISQPVYFDEGILKNVILCLGYVGQTTLIEDIINKIWELDSVSVPPKYNITVTSDLLTAIVSAYSKCGKSIQPGLVIADKFFGKIPNIIVKDDFWINLQKWNIILPNKWRSTIDLSKRTWELMKSWRNSTNNGGFITANVEFLNLVYKVLSSDYIKLKDLEWIYDIFQHSLVTLYSKNSLTVDEIKLLKKFQIFTIKKMVYFGHYSKCLQFIKEWSYDAANKQQLTNLFVVLRNRYLQKRGYNQEKEMTKVQKKYDEEEQEDMLLGGLW